MADLIYGKVKAEGKKGKVLAFFEELEDYYDKNMVSHGGRADNYDIEFEFSSKIGAFLAYGDYFLDKSEEYECHIVAELQIEGCKGDYEPMYLEYDNGEIVHGVEEYGLGDL